MSTSPRILDDMAKFAGGTMSFMSSIRQQIRQEIRSKIDELADRMDLVPREEFERLELILQESRRQQADLEKRLEALEKGSKKKAGKK